VSIIKQRLLAILVVASLVLPTVVAPTAAIAGSKSKIKNVIVLVPDGTGSTHTTVARWYKGQPLALDEMVVGGVRTYSAESLITDSAPAATAFATGYKSNSKFVSIMPAKTTMPGVPKIADELRYKPLATVLEGAKLKGKATGIIATANIQHATPAGYSAHTSSRGDYNDIAEQQVYLDVDVMLGGGKQYLVPKNQGGARTDAENLLDVLKAKGYTYIETRDQLMDAQGNKLYGAFAKDAMAYEFDRTRLHPSQPTLAEMTQKAIELLSRDKDGFFLFVEGSKVDWASHANDPIGVISDVLAFDDAVKVALDFAKKDGHTLVLAFSDHGNGGMTIGNKQTDKIYDTLEYNDVFMPLKKAALTGEGIEEILQDNFSEENIRAVVAKYYGVADLSMEEVSKIQKAKQGRLNDTLGPIISIRSGIGWTTNGHTGEDLFLYAYGPDRPVGMVENYELAQITAKALDINLDKINKELFVNAEEGFGKVGATVNIDKTDEQNIKLVVRKGNITAELPFSKNIIIINGKTLKLKGLTVHMTKTMKTFVPEDAIELFAAAVKQENG
jgi:alkaline phosphatase